MARTELTDATAKLKIGDVPSALQLLRLIWAETREPRVASLIENLASLRDSDPKNLRMADVDFSKDPDAADVSILLAFAAQFVIEDEEKFVQEMCAWTPDPRISRSMIDKIEDPELGGRGKYWTAVYDLLIVNADPRFTDLIAARAQLGKDTKRDRAEGRQARRAKDAYEATLTRIRPLSESERLVLPEVEAEVRRYLDPRKNAREQAQHSREDREWQMVDAIVAALDADEPRLVYADWLLEQQDPRGQLISLMIALTKGKRVKGKVHRCLMDHDRDLLGRLFGHVRDQVFERGLLTEMGLWNLSADWPPERIDALVGDVRWRTVQTLHHVSWEDNAHWILRRAPLHSLRRIADLYLRHLLDLATRSDAASLPLECVDDLEVGDEAELLDEFEKLPASVLPHLSKVRFRVAAADQSRFLKIPLFRRAKTLERIE